VNYRTSHQIREQADWLLGPEITDVDGNREERRDTVSVFNGPPPLIRVFEAEAEESQAVGEWLSARVKDGVWPHEVAVFVRSAAQIGRAEAAVKAADLPSRILDERVETAAGHAPSARCTWRKGWSSGPWRSWPATTR
jgi:superfamily I DNA/RNA helicase